MRTISTMGKFTAILLALWLAACGSSGGDTEDTTAPVTSASPAGGTFTETQSVSLSCTDGNGTGCMATFYTTDGSAPTQNSSVYSSAISIADTTTLKFFSVDNAGNEESVRTENYTIDSEVDNVAPVTTASPVGGTFSAAQDVTLTCTDAGSGCADTYYTLDGSDPDTGSAVYATPIAITESAELKFFSVDNQGNQESINSQNYVINIVTDDEPPLTTASPVGGSYVDAQDVTLTCDDGAGSGCDVTYYTVDGSDPDTGSSVYASAIHIDSDTTLKFFSVDVAGNQEAIRTEAYQVVGQCQPGVDTDGDGLEDCDELDGWNIDIELNGDGVISGANEQQVHVTSDPFQADADGDGLEDPDELDGRTNPNRADTDQDGLSDYEEAFMYFSSPTDVDSDNDATGPDHDQQPNSGLFDGNEVNNLHTSPQMEDTDGDDYTDYEEVTGAGEPLVADLPLIDVDIISNLGVSLDAKIQSGCEISGSTMQASYHKDSNRSKRKSETSSKFSFAFSADLHAEAEAGFDFVFPYASASVEADTSVKMSTSRESSTSFEQDSLSENTSNFRRYNSQNCFDNQSVDGGELTATIAIHNAGNRSVYLQNLEIGARRSDLNNPGEFYSLASTTLYPTENDIGGGSTEEHEVSITVSATTAMDLLSDPTGLFFSVNDFEIRDEDGRNFSFIQQTTLNRTGMLEIDYGDGRVERYLIATNVERDASNNPAGVNLAWAMEEVLGLDFATEDNGQGISALAWVDNETNYKYDASKFKYWFLLGSSDSLDVPDIDFEDIVLKQGDIISLTLLQDLDNDGLYDREEDYYGTDLLDPDTDRDMIDDRTEADSARRHPVVPEFPAGKRVRQTVNAGHIANLAQNRTLVLLENGTVWELAGEPVKLETDLEFASIAGGGSDNWGFTWFGITTDGDLYAWGSNMFGKLGIQESQPIEQAEPVRVGPACGCWKQVDANELHVLAIKTDGSLWSWGFGAQGQLGYGSIPSGVCPGASGGENECSREPVLVDAGPWLDIAAGARHSLGIKEDHTLWAWGQNHRGQLGTGDTTDRNAPTRVYDAYYGTYGDDTWRMVDAWYDTSLAVLDIGANESPPRRMDNLRSWGRQNFSRYGVYVPGSTYIHYELTAPNGQPCSTHDQCPESYACTYWTGSNFMCQVANAFILEPRLLMDSNAPDDPIVSISAGPASFATWGNIVRTGAIPPYHYHWEATYSASWGYNNDGETGRGPGGADRCVHIQWPVLCNRFEAEMVDDNGDPFLFIDNGRGISAPPQSGGPTTPPPILGELNVWGINDAGQLGLGYGSPAEVNEPELVPEYPLP